MVKLKLGVISDDKPVKLTIEISAATHRDLLAYAEVLGRRDWPIDPRPGTTDCAHGDPVHGN